MNLMSAPENASSLPVTEKEQKALARVQQFMDQGSAYAREHGTRTATIGLVLSASPLALLAWISEKFLEWTDDDPALDTILESVTLYYLTDTFPRCIYPYRNNFGAKRDPEAGKPESKKFHTGSKPMGFSWFPCEIAQVPRSWTEQSTDNLLFYREHERGGHFAALERPEDLWRDVEEFAGLAWKQV